MLKEVRELILRKCAPAKQQQIRAIFERHPFGELERLITQKLMAVVKRVAKEELESEKWLQLVAKLSGRSYEQMRVIILEFLDTDSFSVSVENSVTFLDPVIESWDIDLMTFAMDIVLNRSLAQGYPKGFEFVEKDAEPPFEEERGLKEFLRDRPFSGDATEEEIEFLGSLRFKGKSPTALYYYRELQSLRDPLHFRRPAIQARQTKKMGRILSRKVQLFRCKNTWTPGASRNSCSLTAGKRQQSAGRRTNAPAADYLIPSQAVQSELWTQTHDSSRSLLASRCP